MSEQPDPGSATPTTVRQLDSVQAGELARLASVFEDLQYVLRCCEHLVGVLGAAPGGPVTPDPALIEALWTGALVGYARCFSGQAKVLTDADLGELDLGTDIAPTHSALKRLRDTFASRHVNPREAFTVGAALDDQGAVAGVAITSATTPAVDAATVRLLGRIAYGLSALVDARMRTVQSAVLTAAAGLSPDRLARLPEVALSVAAE